MARIDFDAEIAALAEHPLDFKLFDRVWHGKPSLTLAEKRAIGHVMQTAQDEADLDGAVDSLLDMVCGMVVPAERDEFRVEFEAKGDESLAMMLMQRLTEAYAARPTTPPNGSKVKSGRTSGSSTAGALPVASTP